MADPNGIANRTVGNINIGQIRQNAVALRDVDKEKIEYQEMLDSVRKRGILMPILVREYKNPENANEILYGLIDGLQRYNCALDAGLKTVPAQIVTMDQAEIEETQIIANCQRIETRPIEYARQIERLFERNPTLSVQELSGRLSKSEGWVYKVLGMNRNLHDDIKPLVDDRKITGSNAYELSKLPKDEQADWIERSMTMDPGEFTAAVANRVKAIREARRKGRAEAPAVFEPVAHQRKWTEIKEEYEKNGFGPALVQRAGVKTPEEGFKLAIAWICHMDPDSQNQQRADNDARVKRRSEESDARKLERAQKQQQEGAKLEKELKEKMAKAGV